MLSSADPTLFVILADDLADAGGEITPAIAAELDALPLSVATSDGIIDMIRSAEAEELDAKALAAPHVARARAAALRAENLKSYLQRRMEAEGVDKLSGPRHQCRLQDNPGPKITWPGAPATIPYPFQRTKVELDPNAAKAAYYQGTLPDGFVVETGRHLRIVV